MIQHFNHQDTTLETSAEPRDNGADVVIGNNSFSVSRISDGKYSVELNGVRHTVCCVIRGDRAYVDVEGILLELSIPSEDGNAGGGDIGLAGEKDKIYAPMPGKIVKLLVKEGDEVAEKQPLVIVEAMKMENQVNAAAAGTVRKINFSDGDQVDTDTPIIELEI
ncbi:MAG: biotin/lipoyl-binding protein [Candidatus Zixiibacteriota bacterium]|nr:MAG: biotin/lipoyl-binding protein [candidate division Zixibacteria bacterium]